MKISNDINLYEEHQREKELVEKFFGSSYRPFAGDFPCEPYFIIVRKPRMENHGDEYADNFKRFFSCVFSYGTFRNKIETLSVKKIYHIALATFVIISLLALLMGVASAVATGKIMMGFVAFILVFSFGYASIQLLNLCADRLIVLRETDAVETTVLWPTKKINNDTPIKTYDELYPTILSWGEKNLPFVSPLMRGIIHFPLVRDMANSVNYNMGSAIVSVDNLNYLFSIREEGEIFLLYNRRIYKFEQ